MTELREVVARAIYDVLLEKAGQGGDFVGEYEGAIGFTCIDGDFDLKVVADAALAAVGGWLSEHRYEVIDRANFVGIADDSCHDMLDNAVMTGDEWTRDG